MEIFKSTHVSRFLRDVKMGSQHECWEWQGSRTNKGYGQFGFEKKMYFAHRFSWEYHNGLPIPAKGQVCHSCDNPPCVNPEHLWLGTNLLNYLDRLQKGRSSQRAKSIICKVGHTVTGENLLLRGSVSRPERRCRACYNDAIDKYCTPKSHCLRGHPMAGRNLIVKKNSKRGCRACKNLKRRKT